MRFITRILVVPIGVALSYQVVAAPIHADSAGSQGWSLPRLWSAQEQSEAPVFQPEGLNAKPAPSVLDRMNPMKWGSTEPKQEKKFDPISLDVPAGKPTPEFMISIAQVCEAQGNSVGAREHYVKAVGLAPNNAKTLREAAHFEDRQGQLREAEGLYNRALVSEPTNAAILNDLALCLARQGRLQESVSLLERAIQIQPTKALYRNNMATVLVEMNDPQQALAELASVHHPAVANYNVGHLLAKRGQTDLAAQYYAEALRINPQLMPAQNALAQMQSQPLATPQMAMRPSQALRVEAAPPSYAPVVAQPGSAWGQPTQPVTPPSVPVNLPPVENAGPRLLPPVR